MTFKNFNNPDGSDSTDDFEDDDEEEYPETPPDEAEFDSAYDAMVYLATYAKIDPQHFIIDNEYQISLKNQDGIFLTERDLDTGKTILTDWGIRIVDNPTLVKKDYNLEELRAARITQKRKNTRKKVAYAMKTHPDHPKKAAKAKKVAKKKGGPRHRIRTQ